MDTAIEIVEFTTDPAAGDAVLADRAAAIRAMRAAFPAMIDAHLYRGAAPGSWIDVVRWRDLTAAHEAAATAAAIAEVATFFAHLTGEPVMHHGTLAVEDPRG